MTKAIYFDMDGTVYDLYGVDGWLDMLKAEDATAYACGRALYDMDALANVMRGFVARGFVVGVITWTAMNGSTEYNKQVRKVKREWIKQYMPYVTEFHCVKYGTPKHRVANVKGGILVDDNEKVRDTWDGTTIDACEDIVKALKVVLDRV